MDVLNPQSPFHRIIDPSTSFDPQNPMLLEDLPFEPEGEFTLIKTCVLAIQIIAYVALIKVCTRFDQ